MKRFVEGLDPRHLAGGMLLVLVLSLPACGGGGGNAAPTSGAAATSSSPSPASTTVADAAALDKSRSRSDSPACSDVVQLLQALKQGDAQSITLWNADAVLPMLNTPCVSVATLLSLAVSASLAATSLPDKVAAVVNRDNPWGVGPSAFLSQNPQAWLPAMAEAGVKSVRGFDGVRKDDAFTPITDAGMSVVGFLKWSPPDGPQTLPVNDLEGWRHYVTSQVRRYRGRVKYWEVWNEPPNFTVDMSPASYAKVVAAAYDAAKAVDPSVQIGLAAKSNHVNYLAESIAAGAADKFDFVTLHPYEVASWLPQGSEGTYMAIAPRVRQMLQAKNPAKASVPIWFTEIGYSAKSTAADGPGPQLQADMLVKIYTMGLAQGVGRSYWFDPKDSEGLTMGLTTADGTKRPAWQAMRSLSTYLGPRPLYIGWTQPGNAWYGFVFVGPQGVVLSAWARAGQSSALSLASDVKVLDPRTGAVSTSRTPTITEAPAVLLAPIGSAQARQWLADASASNGKPFPWNGDHSHSTSVQLTAGAPPDGLFMGDAPAATVVNDVPEFNLEGRIGACFAVDPTFVSLAYVSTPLRVTAVVRGHGNGDPGFTLRYESDAPLAATGNTGFVPSGDWFPIVGTSFYEKTWSLPDSRFVGMFGYNFCFDASGAAHSQFSIRQVTVSR